MAQIALLPVAPLLLLPFIVLFFVIVFPIWLVAVIVLGVLLGLARLVDAALRVTGVSPEPRVGPVMSNAFHWTLSWGGLAERRDRPRSE